MPNSCCPCHACCIEPQTQLHAGRAVFYDAFLTATTSLARKRSLAALAEGRPGGQSLIFDKFLRRGKAGWKRLLNPLTRRVATRLDVVFEDVLEAVGGLDLKSNQAALASGWFRLIRLEKSVR
ncbi:MAG: hypothetical protein M0Z99_08755 [Betaproteobacteria bacterium]|nr:hypothetical protein [Betaproteobacteria bacterium]